MKEIIFSDSGFIAISIVALVSWLIFGYWQIRYIRRILVVSRSQHKIPENVFWLKRARMAVESDYGCQVLQRRRNVAAVVFIAVVAVTAIILAVAKIYG